MICQKGGIGKANYCHLSYEDRKNIEDGLNNNYSINSMAISLNRNHSTILREIDRNKKYLESSNLNNYKTKNYYRDLSCEKLKKPPYVCNGCKFRRGCRKQRLTYYGRESQNSYEQLIINCRQGIKLNLEDINVINNVIIPLVKKVKQQTILIKIV